MSDIDAAVIAALSEDVVTPDLVEDVIARLREMLEPEPRIDEQERLARELAGVEGKIANLTNAIEMADGSLAVLVARLQKAERDRLALVQALDELPTRAEPTRVDWRVV